MSAWTVSHAHIDCLVQAGIEHRLVIADQHTPSALGRMLWDENYRQVNYRYGEDHPTPDYRFRGIEARLDPVIVVKALACYRYQCWENTEAWEASESRRYTDSLLALLAAAAGVPDVGHDDLTAWARALPAYDCAPWGIDRLEQAVAS